MRTAIWYLISVSLHGAAMAAIALIPSDQLCRPPSYAVLRGGGGGLGGEPAGEAPTLKSSFSASTRRMSEHLVRLRIEPAQAAAQAASRPISSLLEPEKAPPEVHWRRPAAAAETIASMPPDVVAIPKLSRLVAAEAVARTAVGGSAATQRSMPQLSPMDVLAAAEPEQTSRTDTRYRVAGGNTPGGRRGPPGDGRAVGPGGGGADQSPSASAWNPSPPYPPDALARGVEGLVLLRVSIGVDGSVQAVTIQQSSGDASLDESALGTVRDRWRFAPARKSGVGVPWIGLLPIRFRLHAS